MTETYTCPRCAERYGDRTEDDSLWFMKNSGFIDFGCCPECRTPEEFEVIDKTWREYTSRYFGANK